MLFPSLQYFVVAALCLNHLSGFWVLIDLDLALPA